MELNDCDGNRMIQDQDSPKFQLECAREIVRILFDRTGLSKMIRTAPEVIVGEGNWISFGVDHAVSSEAVLALKLLNGEPAFAADALDPVGRARSRTTPSLHLMNLASGENLGGHVDAYYWAKNLIGHAEEFLRMKTAAPSELMQRLKKVHF
jgi:hypothetical protein